MKKILIILVTGILTACGGGEDNKAAPETPETTVVIPQKPILPNIEIYDLAGDGHTLLSQRGLVKRNNRFSLVSTEYPGIKQTQGKSYSLTLRVTRNGEVLRNAPVYLWSVNEVGEYSGYNDNSSYGRAIQLTDANGEVNFLGKVPGIGADKREAHLSIMIFESYSGNLKREDAIKYKELTFPENILIDAYSNSSIYIIQSRLRSQMIPRDQDPIYSEDVNTDVTVDVRSSDVNGTHQFSFDLEI